MSSSPEHSAAMGVVEAAVRAGAEALGPGREDPECAPYLLNKVVVVAEWLDKDGDGWVTVLSDGVTQAYKTGLLSLALSVVLRG